MTKSDEQRLEQHLRDYLAAIANKRNNNLDVDEFDLGVRYGYARVLHFIEQTRDNEEIAE